MDSYIQNHFAGALAYKYNILLSSFACLCLSKICSRIKIYSPIFCRELVRCLKWYMDRSAEVVRQDHIQEAMRVSSMCFFSGSDSELQEELNKSALSAFTGNN